MIAGHISFSGAMVPGRTFTKISKPCHDTVDDTHRTALDEPCNCPLGERAFVSVFVRSRLVLTAFRALEANEVEENHSRCLVEKCATALSP